jgi:hypothetical protein
MKQYRLMEHKTLFFDGLVQASRKLELDYEGATIGASELAAQVRSATAIFLEGYLSRCFRPVRPGDHSRIQRHGRRRVLNAF